MRWHVGIATGACVEAPILDALPAINASGARALEIGTPPRHFNPLLSDQIATLATGLRAHNLAAVSIHAPFGGRLDLADPNPHHRHDGVAAVRSAAAAIKHLGGRLVIVHPSDLKRDQHDVQARLESSVDSLRLLGHDCHAEGVELVIESPLPHLIGGHPDEFAWILARLPQTVRVCLDTGHTWLGHHWRPFLNVAGDRLAHVHANDNHGHRDDHLPPGDGRIDWVEVARTLDAVSFSGWMMLELRCPSGDLASYFTRAYEQTQRLFSDALGPTGVSRP